VGRYRGQQCHASLVVDIGWGRIVRHAVLLLAIVVVMPIHSVGFGAAAQELASTTPESRISGAIDIGDRSLGLDCLGSGSPTVVLDAGQDNPGSAMAALQSVLSKDVLTCVYDRAGQGRSDPPAQWPRSAADVIDDLHALLLAAKVPGPYVLVGQSAGGNFVQLYARTYPEEVVGVVAMNPVPPANPWLADAAPLMTEQERDDEEAYYRGEFNAEAFDWIASSEQLEAAPPPPDVPFLLLISTIAQCESPDDVCGRTYGVYEAVMQAVAGEWQQGRYAQIAGGHVFYNDPDAQALMRRVIAAASDPSTWATPLTGTPTA
jgi:pimeloyl-ACP methyl ester carboxylesterase